MKRGVRAIDPYEINRWKPIEDDKSILFSANHGVPLSLFLRKITGIIKSAGAAYGYYELHRAALVKQ